jgi:hypothetical protein
MARDEKEMNQDLQCVGATKEAFAGWMNECDALDERECLVELFRKDYGFGTGFLCKKVRHTPAETSKSNLLSPNPFSKDSRDGVAAAIQGSRRDGTIHQVMRSR